MSSHIPSHRSATEATRTDDARGPDGTPADGARDAVQLDGDVLLSLLARIGGGSAGAELKDAAGGGPQAQGQPAGTAPGPARTASGAPGMRGGAAGPAAPGTGLATQTGILPALTGSTQAGGDAVSGIVPDERGDAAQQQAPDLATPEGALPLPSIPEAGLLHPPGAENAWQPAADAQPMSRTAGQYDIGPHADGEAGEAGETRRAPAEAMAFAGAAAPRVTAPLTGTETPAEQAAPLTATAGHAAPDAERRASTPPAIATSQMPSARHGGAIPPARSARDVMADAAGTAGRYASATVRRAGTLAAATGRSLVAHGATLPGVRALEANLVERGWMPRHARSSDEAGIGSGAGADAGDPSSVASGNEAAGVVNVVRYVVQARDWLDERRPRTPAGNCPHRRSLRCRWYCRAGCTRRGA
ncbi:MAG: hypothetical protein LBJ65_01575 [Burkholderia sp.]|jgi:hypothetical protein|uniref:hypothetical protein n=1 Tax=Burkholderia sp. TaxID=36773 RepID=UPI002833A09C|nr:hypothetical protein [Burkholderia sp.]MDR0240282.1 hypothetical protein [Burkholderia sp.]